MKTLLFEIGTEEIPAGYIQPALDAMAAVLTQRLDEARIGHGPSRTFGTPRRLAVMVADVAAKQTAVTAEILGPPEKVAFDSQGRPTVAAEKFAGKVGMTVKDLVVRQTDKGAYLCAVKTEPGQPAEAILQQILPPLALGLPFPKSMRWADLTVSFARPIHSVLALLGGKVIDIALGDVQSGRYTFGHRFMAPSRIKIQRPEEYLEALRNAFVIADIGERRTMTAAQVAAAATSLGGKVLADEDLLDTVTQLVEYPVASAGRFEKEFLQIPDEILITAMRRHQKYFAVADGKGRLKAGFIAVNNTASRDAELVTKGHQRVLRARLKDAQFFSQADLQVSSDQRAAKLVGVLFQAKLGSMAEKTERIKKLSGFLAQEARLPKEIKAQVLRAAALCKSDLVSQVVGEFPELQGTMGRIYAGAEGEAADVAAAIEEHYRPTYSGGPLPSTMTGAILAVADKVDSIAGCFSVGLVPTGASDPYALRRQGIGIVQILLDNSLTVSLCRVVEKGIGLYRPSEATAGEIALKVMAFLQNRMAHLLAEQGFAKDVIAAVLEASVDCVPDVWNRVQALEALRAQPDFEPLAVAFKRVGNILKKAGVVKPRAVNAALFQDPCEKHLMAACDKAEKAVALHLDRGHIQKGLLAVAALRQPVDAFFDGVMVMAEDKKVQANRLALLSRIADLFGRFADFSRIG
jgi:glycyl-tRNA synthetase beta chain